MALQGALAEHDREGKEVLCGEMDLDGSNPTPITTGFATIDAVEVQLKGSSAPGTGTSLLTYDVSGNVVNVYAWKPTGSGDTTLVASTGTETFSYTIIGRRR